MNSSVEPDPGIAAIGRAFERALQSTFVLDANNCVQSANRKARALAPDAVSRPLSAAVVNAPASLNDLLDQARRMSAPTPLALEFAGGRLAFLAWRVDPTEPGGAPLLMVQAHPVAPLAARLIQTENLSAAMREKLNASESEHRQLRREAAQLRQQNARDCLTGLLNAAAFERKVRADLLGTRGRHGAASTLVFVDLNGFKSVNDTHGHDAGDAVLRAVGAGLMSTIRNCDVAARLGGDEFGLWLPGMDAAGLPALLDRIVTAIAAPVDWKGIKLIGVSAAMGAAFAGVDATTFDDLRSCADARMYHAKWGRSGQMRIGPTAPGMV